jgi:hypothetical protein
MLSLAMPRTARASRADVVYHVINRGNGRARVFRKPADTRPPWLADGPVPLPDHWTTLLNRPQTDAEERALRNSLARNAPFGDPAWQGRTAHALGLQSSLRPRGRPRVQTQRVQPRPATDKIPKPKRPHGRGRGRGRKK